MWGNSDGRGEGGCCRQATSINTVSRQQVTLSDSTRGLLKAGFAPRTFTEDAGRRHYAQGWGTEVGIRWRRVERWMKPRRESLYVWFWNLRFKQWTSIWTVWVFLLLQTILQ